MQLAKHKREWPNIPQPVNRGNITVADVIAAAPGPERDRAIHSWCASVWSCWKPNAEAILELVRTDLSIQ